MSAATPLALLARDLVVQRGARHAVNGVSMAVAPGQITVLAGPNGAGKSTLLAALAGLLPVQSGQVELNGEPLHQVAPRARAQAIGYLPQSPESHWDINVETLVALGRLPHSGRFTRAGAADAAAIGEAMETMQVSDLAQRPIARLSGGERARAMMARVLAGQPQWLLADEPLANLDIGHAAELLRALRRIADSGTGVLLVLHDLDAAMRIADKAVLMDCGQVAASGDPAEVFSAARLEAIYRTPLRWLDDGQGARALIQPKS